ncbi:MAG: bile acid-coenzyme ligase [Actinomycetota bacterium]|nr:bile acid-coenzyme ligase [Actinomycetota bacterium]
MTAPADVVPMGQRFSQLAAERPDGPALTSVSPTGQERTVSWQQLDTESTQLARVLQARGLGAGERLALELQNSVELVLSVVAAWKLGAVPVPMRWDLPDWERARLLDVVAPKLTIRADDLQSLTAAREAESAEPLPVVVGPQVNGICSSGSTGIPKVILSDRPAVWTPEQSTPFAELWGPVPRPQTILVPAPMYHTNGFATLFSLLGGDRLIVLAKFDAELVVDLVERHRVTNFTATPTMLQRIARVPGIDDRDLSSIAWILQGAAVIPPALVHRWIELLDPTRIVMAYGMTEALGLTALRGDEWLAHPGSVGRGFRGTEIRIVGEDGQLLPPGEIGEIYLRSPTTGLYTYLGGAPLLPTTDDGFGTAGDLGHLDEDGYLYIADRRVDMIITGGANVFPAEVESALSDHPAIADVVVIGLSDPEWGRRVHAVVEPADPAAPPSPDDVIAYAKSRLAAYKVPKTVELVERIPRSAATKVSRSTLVAEREG